MLLSMYASYHWARSEDYVRNIGFFILLISFFSAFFPLSIIIFLAFPVTFLSFPFYGTIEKLLVGGIPGNWGYFVTLRFLTIDITSTPTEASFFFFPALMPAFPLFLASNLLGALLGYWIGTKYRIHLFSSKWWKVLWGFIGITSIGLGFVFGALGYVEEDFGVALFSFGIAMLETIILSYLLNNWTSIISVQQ